ncbi:MAG: nicotinate-nucleotide--dimethylbenzimidazole phosphoribosyltransferase [Actinobacteria bacterium]|nr:nicotinate-nucleotide--dimethylbenzimidazole phosphoribosyltransferase [Actinomycetota bacterium]
MNSATLTGLLAEAPQPDSDAAAAVAARVADILRPKGALARLDDIAVWLAGWQRSSRPAVKSPAVLLFAGDHGVCVDGVSAYPAEVTGAMCHAMRSGVATVTAMAGTLDATVELIDVGVGKPTGNLRVEPAMSEERFGEAFGAGRAAVARIETDLLVLGEMGIGNTTAAATIAAAVTGSDPSLWVGSGTGVNSRALEGKRAVVSEAVRRIADVTDPLEVLRQVGGTELVAMAGAAVEARLRSIPVLLDGYVVTAALYPLEKAVPGALDHTLAGHVSSEPGHRKLLELLGKKPLLDLGLRLGEASGALAALPLVRLAAVVVTDVATFAEVGLGR